MSQSAAYNAKNEFVLNYIWTDEDKDFPFRLLTYYNKDVPNPGEQLNVTDVQQLTNSNKLNDLLAVEPQFCIA
jgi:hypothetical protein